MIAAVLDVTMVGSYVANLVPNRKMSSFSVFTTLLLSIKYIVKPVMTAMEKMAAVSAKKTRRAVHRMRGAGGLYLRIRRRGRR